MIQQLPSMSHTIWLLSNLEFEVHVLRNVNHILLTTCSNLNILFNTFVIIVLIPSSYLLNNEAVKLLIHTKCFVSGTSDPNALILATSKDDTSVDA